MKRTKPTKKKQQELRPPDNGLGGFMPNPPQNCPFPLFTVISKEKNSNLYQDLGNCIRCNQKCQRFLEFQKEWENYKRRRIQIYNELNKLNEQNE